MAYLDIIFHWWRQLQLCWQVTKGNESRSFFSIPEFEEWKSETANHKSWKVRYYKGLGTSTSKEGKEYFSNMQRHRIVFNYDGPSSDQALVMVSIWISLCICIYMHGCMYFCVCISIHTHTQVKNLYKNKIRISAIFAQVIKSDVDKIALRWTQFKKSLQIWWQKEILRHRDKLASGKRLMKTGKIKSTTQCEWHSLC